VPLLEIDQLEKGFRTPDGNRSRVVDIPASAMKSGAQVALCGPSGLGKSTLLNLVAGIIKPDRGRILIEGVDVTALPESRRDRLRATTIGYIFQTFNLLPAFTCLENVLLGMSFGPGVDVSHAEHLLKRVGLGQRLRYFPRQLSTGQQQRVAVARALAHRPKLVLADEPTGNLDRDNAREALRLIRETCRENGAALLLVSHDRQILDEFDRILDWASINQVTPSAAEVGS
jgi:putative ABC transport system ATP-binding protein